jgi:hypothetical protein
MVPVCVREAGPVTVPARTFPGASKREPTRGPILGRDPLRCSLRSRALSSVLRRSRPQPWARMARLTFRGWLGVSAVQCPVLVCQGRRPSSSPVMSRSGLEGGLLRGCSTAARSTGSLYRKWWDTPAQRQTGRRWPGRRCQPLPAGCRARPGACGLPIVAQGWSRGRGAEEDGLAAPGDPRQ